MSELLTAAIERVEAEAEIAWMDHKMEAWVDATRRLYSLRERLELSRAETDERVSCDDGCEAFAEPLSPSEYRAAYDHWCHHGFLSGCAHGR